MRNKADLFFANGAYWATAAFYTPFISMFYAQRGMDSMQIGVLSSILSLSSLLIQPFWARVSDRTGKRKEILMALCLCCAAAILTFLLDAGFKGLFCSALLYAVFNSAVLPLSDALIVNEAGKRGMDFSKIRMTGTLSYAFVVFVIGFFLKKHISLMFIATSISFLIFFLILKNLSISDENIESASEDNSPKASSKKGGRIFRSNEAYFILVFAFAMQLGLYYMSTFLGVMLNDMGESQSLLGVLSCVSALSEVPILLIIGKLRNRFRPMTLLTVSVLSMSLRLFMMSSGIVPIMLISEVLQGPSYMIMYYVCVVSINELIMPGKVSQGQSMLAIVQTGLGSLSGTLLGGFIAQIFGARGGFVIFGILLMFIACMTSFIYAKREASHEKDLNFNGDDQR